MTLPGATLFCTGVQVLHHLPAPSSWSNIDSDKRTKSLRRRAPALPLLEQDFQSSEKDRIWTSHGSVARKDRIGSTGKYSRAHGKPLS